MMYVTNPPQPFDEVPRPGVHEPPSVTVHALKQNKRPVGFAPWPKAKRKKKRGSA